MVLIGIIMEIRTSYSFLNYRISYKKRRASNKRRPLIGAAPLGIHIEISASF